MQSKQTKTFRVKEPIDQVWNFLSDPRKVAPCLPGAQITEAVDDKTYKGTITVKIGPVSTSYKGEIKILRRDETAHEMELAGSGQDPRGGGGATMKLFSKLTPLPDGGTEITGTNEVTVTGKLAQFGSRMMDDVSNHLFNQFTKSFQQRLSHQGEPTPQESNAVSALPIAGAVLKGAVKRIFGKDED
jgi:uncharacterized protein